MTQTEHTGQRHHEAIEWFVRLQDCDDEIVWQDHRDWLEANPANVAAYAEIEAFWVDLEAATPLGDATDPNHHANAQPAPPQADVISLPDHPRARARWRSKWLPVAAAASIAAILAVPQLQDILQSGQTYRTDATHLRQIALADGSSLTLNRNTEITVRLGRKVRSATLESGEVAFNIHHESSRPFVVTAGARSIRVLGTEFNVLHQNGTFAVTVRRGLVSVSTETDAGHVVHLPAGLAFTGDANARNENVSTVSPDNAFAWRTGRLVYTDTPVEDVARDLARYCGTSFTVAPDLRTVRVTAVLKIGDEANLRHQIESLLPVRVEQDGKGGRKIVARQRS